jgi:hypothetical protein
MTIFRQEVRPCRRVAGARRGHSGGELDARSGDRAVPDPSPRRCSFRARPPLHGAGAISARADVGLLRLVEALDKAGIDAEVLPTAVTIDKRASDGDKGYSASLEREAGVGAVSALDDYRASVLEAIKAGKSQLLTGGRIMKQLARPATAIAGLITAVAALVGALVAADIMGSGSTRANPRGRDCPR